VISNFQGKINKINLKYLSLNSNFQGKMYSRIVENELISQLSYFPAVGIIGPRQVGKTTLAKAITEKLNLETLYIDLENPEDESKLFDPVLFFRENENRCVILDEVQRRPDLFPVMRSMIDQNRRAGRFVMLGSASPELIRDTSESLAGRIAYLELNPLNLLEIEESIENQKKLWLRGGFPNSLLAPNDKLSKTWRTNFIRSYIERDLPMLGLDADKALIMRLWRMLAHAQGGVVNYSALSRSLGVTSNTVKKYISFLEGAFLLRSLQPYHANVKKRLVKSPKVFVRDSGILLHLLSVYKYDDLTNNPILGAAWEGFVMDQIIAICADEFDYAFYRTHEGTECDLVLLEGDKPKICVEIKFTASPKPSKGMLQAFKDLQAEYNYIITPYSNQYKVHETIEVIGIRQFIEKHLPKNE
jgi:uncharacterized protein